MRALKGIARDVLAHFSTVERPRKGPFDAEWDGHIFRSAAILLFLVISPSDKGLAHATMSLILVLLPTIGKAKTSTPCRPPPHPHQFLNQWNLDITEGQGTGNEVRF